MYNHDCSLETWSEILPFTNKSNIFLYPHDL